ncbi:MmcQ/YjbR family DNA-binding protein [Stakelama saccharophila]|uniref:MmcQ/YjbR family DNA-binding protein n=1 Tax=Stakelama saccharophila TaxID=3075605 RepID=A0ABZ0B6C0_9SPHN|nr:MmcQ/YjbR family DNA-binding protein [Stakelama sp. W311]WNO52681.1 hypothetical protein RPR59_09410 [Stakelama sp. W311]
MTWEEAVAQALALPDTARSTRYGKPAVAVASNGRAFLSRGHEPRESFCLALDRDTVEMLMETDPDTFYQTPHYVGWPAILVRYDTSDPDRVRTMIERARDQAAARKPVRRAVGNRHARRRS